MAINASVFPVLLLLMAGGVLTGATNPIHAANECRVKYQYTVSTGTFSAETKTKFLNLNLNQTTDINQSNMLWIQNLNDYKVRVHRSGFGSYVDLDKSGRDPGLGNYFGNVVLQKIQCRNELSGGSFQTAAAMVDALKATGTSLNQIAAQVADAFNVGGQQMAELLKAAQYDAGQVAGALRIAFNASGQQVAEWMKQAGYSTAQVAGALKSALNATGQQVAEWMRESGYNQSGYSIGEVAAALKNVFNVTGQQVAKWMTQAGYNPAEVAGALRSALNATGQQVAEWMRESGYNQSGYSIAEVAAALKSAFNATGQQVAQWMKQAGYSAVQIASALKSSFNASAQQAAQWLKAAGFAANDVAKVLKDEFNTSAEDAAQLLAAVFSASEQTIRQALALAGYTQAQINAAFQDTANRVARTVLAIDNIITGHTRGYHGFPIAKPDQEFPLRQGENRVTVRGRGMIAVTGISGLPSGARSEIAGRGDGRSGQTAWDYIHVVITVSSRTPAGTKGRASVHAARATGPTFRWVVQSAVTQTGRSTPGRTVPGRGSSGAAPSSSGVAPDLVPLQTSNSL